MLYRGMDRIALDAGYNNRAAVPEHVRHNADWAMRSDALVARRTGHLDVRYGESARERLDLFLADPPFAPTLVFIHGGYWQGNDKEHYRFIGEGVLAHGINFANIEYTLAPEAGMDRIVAEILRGMAWLRDHLGDYGADPARLYVAGHSAGAHLTAAAVSAGGVRGGLATSGVYDLEPVRLNYLNEKLRMDEAEARRNSPQLNLPAKAGGLILSYGTAELPELCRQSIEYAACWRKQGLPGQLIPIEGADHFSILEKVARPDGALLHSLMAMMTQDALA